VTVRPPGPTRQRTPTSKPPARSASLVFCASIRLRAVGLARMRRRLRKKLHLGEFREHGFELSYELRPDVTEDEADVFLDSFIAQVEANGLLCGGGGRGTSWDFLVHRDGRGTTEERHGAALADWLGGQPDVVTYSLGGFVDLWHGPPLP